MKQETLKKIVELATGFDLPPGIGLTFKGDDNSKEFYPLLLRRAVEGWNDQCGSYDICIDSTGLLYEGRGDHKIFKDFKDYQKTDYLTPQEQAIEACLIELLEK